uniref:Uncharacterized protein n=1 Tax=Ditylum brightwellii TaxID=49249 RepID=A0A7S4R3I6_9STRA
MNRIVQPLSHRALQSKKLHDAHFGFMWNDGDGKTNKFRPQGITSFTWSSLGGATESKDFHFVLVTWYGRTDEGYDNRGVRISLVDITDISSSSFSHTDEEEMKQIKYRHILLVDENFCTFTDLHAGGVAYRDGKIYVPDSRHHPYTIHVFDIFSSIYEVTKTSSSPNEDLQHEQQEGEEEGGEDVFFNYRYVLQKEYTFIVPIKPSFLSYDSDRDSFVIGTYKYCGGDLMKHTDSEDCRKEVLNHLFWFDLGDVNNPDFQSSSSCGPFFSEMQGAASGRYFVDSATGDIITDTDYNESDDIEEKGFLLVSSSYGPVWSSHLHSFNFDPRQCEGSGSSRNDVIDDNNDGITNQINDDIVGDYDVFTYPSGLEDLHIEPSLYIPNNLDGNIIGNDSVMKRNVWMLTEHGERMIFATHLEALLPN